MYLNKAFIIGNLTRDPELKALPSGMSVASFSVATNRVWKDAKGAKQESADYHNIVVFGRQAETAAQYLKKGSSVYVEGRMQTRSWDGQDGKKQYRTEVVADRVQFGERRGDAGSNQGGSYEPKSAPKSSKEDNALDNMPSMDYPEEEINPEDIPF
ncbi:MAG: single-stranded DNA-binding protein [Candidatus Taylorbacteria bacterium]|nr:single-stranded DNA-binding protein [Candidatus Taylorbacteria bacterium]